MDPFTVPGEAQAMESMWQSHLRGTTLFSTSRILTSGPETGLSMRSVAVVTWYCLGTAMTLFLLISTVWCWFHRYMGHRRVVRALQREQELEAMSRIEANLRTFGKAVEVKRTRLVKSVLRDQVKVITEAEIRTIACEGESWEGGSNTECPSLTCSICLQDFAEGDKVATSSDSLCRHIFHEHCMVSWLVTRQYGFCPCCRRPFVCLPTPQTSVASHDQSSTFLGDMESSRPDVNSVAPIDEGGIWDTLEAVLEELPREETDTPDHDDGTVVSQEERPLEDANTPDQDDTSEAGQRDQVAKTPTLRTTTVLLDGP